MKNLNSLINQKHIKNIIWLFVDKVLRLFVNLIILGRIAEYLEIENFGMLNFALSLTALFAPIASLGLDNIAIKKIVENPENENQTITTTFYLKISSSILVFILFSFVSYLYAIGDKQLFYILIIIGATLFFSPLEIFDFYFQAKMKSRISALSRLAVFILSSFAKLSFIFYEFSLICFAWLILFEIILNFTLIGFFFYKIKGFSVFYPKYFNYGEGINLLNKSWTLLISTLSIAIYMRIDQVFLGRINTMEAGYYSAAIRLSEVWNVIPVIICSTLYPNLIDLRKSSSKIYMNSLKTAYKLLFVLGFTICMFSIFFGKNLIEFLYGKSYIPSVEILNLHIWSTIFVFIGVLNNYVLLIENQTKTILVSTVIGSIINVSLNLVFIPNYGGLGSALATLVSYFVAVVFIFFFPKQNFVFFRKLFITN